MCFRPTFAYLGVLCLYLAPMSVCAGENDAQIVADTIDRHVAAKWKVNHVQPAPAADDAAFLRRVYLDLAGRIPRVSEARDFLDDAAPDKRARLVGRLLDGPQYVNHFTNYWKGLLLPPSNNRQFLEAAFSGWVNKQVRDNVGYDVMVRDLLTASVVTNVRENNRLALLRAEPTPLPFYQANELKPENLAASASRLFLGVKLECAQCHDHPLAKYTRDQFWEQAAFFSGLRAQGQNGIYQATDERKDQREIAIPGTDRAARARFLDGTEPRWKPNATARATFAAWLTARENPYFARTAANRLWAHFFGIGLIEPIDEPGDDNPPSHPELLDELTRALAEHHFDLKFLMRAIVLSKTYQLASASPDGKEGDPRLFTRMALKGLSPEQLFDSLALAIGYREPPAADMRFAFQNPNTPRAEFLSKFAAQDKRTETETSILQALLLMNGTFVGDATDGTNLERTETLAAVADAPFFTTAQRIETLYLTALARPPRPDEREKMLRYIEKGNPRTALADVFWALLNSTEFILNH